MGVVMSKQRRWYFFLGVVCGLSVVSSVLPAPSHNKFYGAAAVGCAGLSVGLLSSQKARKALKLFFTQPKEFYALFRQRRGDVRAAWQASVALASLVVGMGAAWCITGQAPVAAKPITFPPAVSVAAVNIPAGPVQKMVDAVTQYDRHDGGPERPEAVDALTGMPSRIPRYRSPGRSSQSSSASVVSTDSDGKGVMKNAKEARRQLEIYKLLVRLQKNGGDIPHVLPADIEAAGNTAAEQFEHNVSPKKYAELAFWIVFNLPKAEKLFLQSCAIDDPAVKVIYDARCTASILLANGELQPLRHTASYNVLLKKMVEDLKRCLLNL